MMSGSSPEYAKIPAGSIVKWGNTDDTAAKLKPLPNCRGVGAMGNQGGFVDCTTLADTQKQYISDLPDGPEKTLLFIDNPGDENFTALLNAAEQRETIQFYVELPNGRTSTSVIALAGWQMKEVAAPASEVIMIEVKGRQNAIKWGVATPNPATNTGAA
ncbi:phage tail protein [Salmonella enterica]|nr:phage tail protein [Salmonella enterica]